MTGKVTDENGAPLAGVVVLVKDGGNNNATVTNTQGVYEIKAPAASTLVFSCLGYSSREIGIGTSNVVDVKMAQDAQSLDEVVVVGYGTQKKKDLTGGLAVVGKQTLEMVSTNKLMDRLVGQVAGLNITTGNEAPGSNQTLLVAGQNSLTASNDPLIVLDGIPYSGGLADLDPNIIESLSVLKDASANPIYGSRGSNGVILIQTERGSKGSFHVTYKRSSPSPNRCSASRRWVPTSSSVSSRTWADSKTITAASSSIRWWVRSSAPARRSTTPKASPTTGRTMFSARSSRWTTS
ncbi:MAG: carboxypeptidase-like regulatory domain-containing protein [Alistipes senegalensis]